MARKPKKLDLGAINEELRAFALAFPVAWADHPWEEHVTKVGKKIFVFHGMSDVDPTKVGICVKLTDENAHALSHEWCTPAGYGLGKSGWVVCSFDATTEAPPIDLLKDWIDESYRNVATKTLIKQLDAERSGET